MVGIRALRRLLKNKGLILAFFVGMILPCYCFSSARCYYEQVNAMFPQGTDHTVSVNYITKVISSNDLQHIVTEIGECKSAYSLRFEELVPSISFQEELVVNGVGGAYNQFKNISLTKGRFFSEKELMEGGKVCVLSSHLEEAEKKAIGEFVRLRGEEFKIIGFSRDYAYKSMVRIPYQEAEQIYEDYYIQQELLLNPNGNYEEQKIRQMIEGLLKNFGEEVDILSTTINREKRKDTTNFAWKMVLSRVIVGAAVFIISYVNIFMALLGKLQQRKEEYAIRLALGATKVKLFAELLRENLETVLVAFIILVCTFQPISRILQLEGEVVFDGSVIIGVAGFAFLFCISLSYMMMKCIMKHSIYELLQNEVT